MKLPDAPRGARPSHTRTAVAIVVALAVVAALAPAAGAGSGGARFVPLDDAALAGFERAPSTHVSVLHSLMALSSTTPIVAGDMPTFPMNPHGAPGVAVADFDGDGDDDVYVTNGPGAANALFDNQFAERGEVGFVDIARRADVDNVDHDSTGVCHGDIDNDGDQDLMVLGRNEANRLHLNRGDGTFVDITRRASVGGSGVGSASCSFGDIDNDGFIDLVVANTFDWETMTAIAVEPWALNSANELYRNLGNGRFVDVTERSGIGVNDLLPAGAAAISWATTMVDVDVDGDVDIVFSDDQGVIPAGVGLDRGFVQVFANDGRGRFTASAHGTPGFWMSQAWADFDCDRTLDVFVSNLGDYLNPLMGGAPVAGITSSRFLYGTAAGLSDPGVGALVANGFGWGAVAEDFDNDGDTDLLYHGGLDVSLFIDASNPGSLLLNESCAGFRLEPGAFVVDHTPRTVHGLATGDFDNDGDVDVVSAASSVAGGLPVIVNPTVFGSTWDGLAAFMPRFAEVAPGEFEATGADVARGDVMVELNDGATHGSVSVTVVGGKGRLPGARVNANAIGAVLVFTPDGGAPATKPITAGTSYASANSLTQVFGLGNASHGTLTVHWPGGAVTTIDRVEAGADLIVKETTCRRQCGYPHTAAANDAAGW